jgi:uncharacterized protein (TIGR00369 family)
MERTGSLIIEQPVRGFVPGIGFLSLPGIDRMRAFIDGRIPPSPVQHLIGARPVQVGHGSCVVTMPASPWFQTHAGFFLSGTMALAADMALGGAILTALPAWSFPVTSDINITYLRPVRLDAGKLIARGRLIDAGRTQGTSEALIEDGEGRQLAHATTRCFVNSIEPQDVKLDVPEPVAYGSPDPYERPLPPEGSPGDAPDFSDLGGLEILRLIRDGSIPAPFMQLTGLHFGSEIEEGRVSSIYPATEWFKSPSGSMYGGILCFFADGLNTAAATTILEPQTATASLDLKVHFLRPALADGGLMTGTGEVVHGGRGLIVARSEVRNSAGKPLIQAVGSFMRRRIRDWVPVVR